GETRIPPARGGAATPSGVTPPVSCTLGVIVASISDFPGLEIDARIDPSISEIGDQIYDEPDQRKNVERGEHHGIVAVEHAFEAEQAEPVEREDDLDQQRAGEERVDERAGEPGDDQQHGIAKDVAVEHLVLAAALGA